jgi:hypothetical protein
MSSGMWYSFGARMPVKASSQTTSLQLIVSRWFCSCCIHDPKAQPVAFGCQRIHKSSLQTSCMTNDVLQYTCRIHSQSVAIAAVIGILSTIKQDCFATRGAARKASRLARNLCSAGTLSLYICITILRTESCCRHCEVTSEHT